MSTLRDQINHEIAQHRAAARGRTTTSEPDVYTRPPDPYQLDLERRRAAEPRAPEQRFAEEWREKRLAEFDAEYARMAAIRAAQPAMRRLSDAELKKYAPPDVYRLALARRRKEEGR